MNDTITDPAEALIREIEIQSAAECQTVIDAADRQGAAIVAGAFATARMRAQATLAEVRQAGAKRLGRALAQIETERRLLDQARAAEILHTGCPSLINTVVDRWQDQTLRHRWIAGMARMARQRLMPGTWAIVHPAHWGDSDAAVFREALAGRQDIRLDFVLSDEFDAGLKVVAGSTVLDGTPERLLADKATTQALLLAEMNRESVLPAELLGEKP